MTDSPDVERLNRIRAALKKLQDFWWEDSERCAGVTDALEAVELVWEPFYEGKSEDRGK